MSKRFNTTGICYPEDHYMVNLESRLQKMEKLVDGGEYFTINRGRQYGKTTTMSLLEEKLHERYAIFFISFEGMGEMAFRSEISFCRNFCNLLNDAIHYNGVSGVPDPICDECKKISNGTFSEFGMQKLSDFISRMCREASKDIILMIDEVDQAGNYDIFIIFWVCSEKNFWHGRNSQLSAPLY